MSACDAIRERLIDVASGRADAEVDAHVEICRDCRAELEDFQAIVSAPDGAPEPLPETAAPRLVREDLDALVALRRKAPAVVAAAVLVTAIGVPVIMSVHTRRDLAELPAGFLYGSIAMLVILGATGILLATRLSGLSRTLAGTFVGLATAAFVGIAVSMPSGPSSIVPLPGADTMRHMLPCFLVATFHGLLPIGLTAWLLSRARFFPAAASLCVGVGAGLLATPVVEMFCPISVTSHLLIAHGGAVVAATLASLAGCRALEKRRVRA